ncbi:integrase/recombinase XerD [Salsuginibacillus halophilus]|uniref:Integrase/recombinase XerD n=1 Tax=Salsuginibacillus halophilus TaxID=517424 RepID=A0A2P8H2U1_9BACI|nr:tyrosine-type recombinase/integrase [Salsuginibacillus halophilus]PSL40535.1 integrase/recombinase XerD [Salsuginibacillus halophilus]
MNEKKEIFHHNKLILQKYYLHMELANRSEHTLESYKRVLDRFFSEVWIPIEDIQPEDVLEWLREHTQGKKETTISTWMSILSSFFMFCEAEEYIDQVPLKSRWRPRLPKPIPKYLDQNELARIQLQSEKSSLRNQILFEFLVTSGCRVGETCALNKTDVDLHTRTVQVKGKGSKIRTVHFSERCAILLEKYMDTLPEETPALFLNRSGSRITRVGVHLILSHMGKKANLSGSLGPHRLRHTFATTLLSKGAELSFIAEELGHSNLDTTRVYARLPKDELVSMYRKYMG